MNSRLSVRQQKVHRTQGCYSEHVELTVDGIWQIADVGDQELRRLAHSSWRGRDCVIGLCSARKPFGGRSSARSLCGSLQRSARLPCSCLSPLHFIKSWKETVVYETVDLMYYYQSVVRPVLEYACPCWHSSPPKTARRCSAPCPPCHL